MMWVKWNLASFRLDTLSVSVQDRCMVCARYTIGLQTFWTHPMEFLGDVGHVEYHFFLFGDSVGVGEVTWVMWNLTSFRLETMLVSVQDGCMVCARRTIGL